MTTVSITSPAGAVEGALELPADVFDAQANIPLMHQVVVAQLAAARQGTHSTKTRGEVSGGGKKPYRQKGTGRARQGSIRSPQFAGGGVSHGPVPHGYLQRTPKKMKAAALRGALSDRAREGRVHVLSALVDGDTPSTKTAAAAIAAVSSAKRILVVVSREDEIGWRSLRNVGSVHLITADQLNTYDVLVSDDLVFTRGALDEFLQFARGGLAVEVDAVAPTVEGKAEKPATKAEKPVEAVEDVEDVAQDSAADTDGADAEEDVAAATEGADAVAQDDAADAEEDDAADAEEEESK
jgi:large subunit ribosomal protein L4